MRTFYVRGAKIQRKRLVVLACKHWYRSSRNHNLNMQDGTHRWFNIKAQGSRKLSQKLEEESVVIWLYLRVQNTHKPSVYDVGGANHVRLVTLGGHQQVLHCFWGDTHPENKNKICIHNTDGRVRRLLTIPEMDFGHSLAVVDHSRCKLVVADHSEGPHASGCLHWVTLSQTYDIVRHEVTQLECRPSGDINVDSSGQVLVTTLCTSKQHPNRLVIYDKDKHSKLQVIDLPDMLGRPASAVNSAPGVFTVVDNWSNTAVWLDSKGQVLRTYGDRPEEAMSPPHHVVGYTEGYLLISDFCNHRLHLLNRKGAFLQYLLCKDLHHIESPRAISPDEQAGLLAVSSYIGTVTAFSLRL